MSEARAPRRNSYYRLLEDNHDIVTEISNRWNAIIDQGRKPNAQERVEMADLLKITDDNFYGLRKAFPGLFKNTPADASQTVTQATTALSGNQVKYKPARQTPSLPSFKSMNESPAHAQPAPPLSRPRSTSGGRGSI
jgi:hypothetical protein